MGKTCNECGAWLPSDITKFVLDEGGEQVVDEESGTYETTTVGCQYCPVCGDKRY